MHILLFGDVIGRPGRAALKYVVPQLRKQHHVDLVIANVENLAHGYGITPETITELRDAGVDVFTSGNHIWKNGKGIAYLATNPDDIIVPANSSKEQPGRRYLVKQCGAVSVGILNLFGQLYTPGEFESPFVTFDSFYELYGKNAITIVDLHAELTGEKRAFGWYVDGRASIVVGTHTHVQTADEQIQPGGTAYITDIGMTGAVDSSLGMDKKLVIQKIAHQQKISLEPPKHPAEVMASGVLVDIDTQTKKARSILRIDQKIRL
ncbi:MAG TPA: TIGR00282 family metallophosphoesterase [Patescibacteria group bacterium]|nr:TIGR00282 family metallophosphoesterase [Patescibacteria group bacterium]